MIGDPIWEMEEWGNFEENERFLILDGLSMGLGRPPPPLRAPYLPLNGDMEGSQGFWPDVVHDAREMVYGFPSRGMLKRTRELLATKPTGDWEVAAFYAAFRHVSGIDARMLSLPAFAFLWIRLLVDSPAGTGCL